MEWPSSVVSWDAVTTGAHQEGSLPAEVTRGRGGGPSAPGGRAAPQCVVPTRTPLVVKGSYL